MESVGRLGFYGFCGFSRGRWRNSLSVCVRSDTGGENPKAAQQGGKSFRGEESKHFEGDCHDMKCFYDTATSEAFFSNTHCFSSGMSNEYE